MENDTKKQIVSILTQNGKLTATAIAEKIERPKPTVNRHLIALLESGQIVRRGKGRSTFYQTALDPTTYFHADPNLRGGLGGYNADVWNSFETIFTNSEFNDIAETNKKYTANISTISPTLLKKEIERITIEFSWKSSQIEGNTYSLLDTERLIKEQKETDGKTHAEAVMILNHKKALDFIFENPAYFKRISFDKIIELHSMLSDGLGIENGIRNHRVGITGSNYHPLRERTQIVEQIEKLTAEINKIDAPIKKALVAVLMLSYIQPFEDGNKRTARMLGNAILVANKHCPISYRSVSEIEYKKAIVLFYEQNDYHYFKRLFIEQFQQAVSTYF